MVPQPAAHIDRCHKRIVRRGKVVSILTTHLPHRSAHVLVSPALGLLALTICLLAACVRPISSTDYRARNVPATTTDRGVASIARTTITQDTPAARAAKEIDRYYDAGVQTPLVRALEILGPPELAASTTVHAADEDDEVRYQRGVALAGLGLVHSARAEFEQVAREGSQVIGELAEERLRALGVASSADDAAH